MRKTLQLRVFLVATLMALLWAWAYHNQVETELTQEDREVISFLLNLMRQQLGRATYEEEIKTIRAVQMAVLRAAPINEGLPLGQAREPRDLIAAGRGLCYDRSRTIEKALRALGFEVRHVSVYSTAERPLFLAMILPSTTSHAVSEVQTKKGWMVVDSNAAWIAIDKMGNPVSLTRLRQSVASGKPVAWEARPPSEVYVRPFVFVCGLYSRHGYFYPPYNRWPDVNYRELFSCIR